MSEPQRINWSEAESASLYNFAEQNTYKALTGETAQIVRFEIKAGTVYPNPDDTTELDEHPNEQFSTVLSGRMRIEMNGNEWIVGPNETISIPPNLPHVAEFLEDTVLLEVFVPPIL